MNSIFTRRSIRKYKDLPVEKDKIEQILKAAMFAPSAGNGQPWEFIVVTDKQKLLDLSLLSPHHKMIATSGVSIVFLANPGNSKYSQFWQQDLAAAMENLLIEACEIGLGGVWLGVAPLKERMDFVTQYFELPEHIIPFSIAAIGYPDEDKNPVERFNPAKIHYNEY